MAEVHILDNVVLSHLTRYRRLPEFPAHTELVEDRLQDQNYGFIDKPNMSLTDIEFNISLHDRLLQDNNFMNLSGDVSFILIV